MHKQNFNLSACEIENLLTFWIVTVCHHSRHYISYGIFFVDIWNVGGGHPNQTVSQRLLVSIPRVLFGVLPRYQVKLVLIKAIRSQITFSTAFFLYTLY